MNRAGRAVPQAPRMVGMRMREHNRARMQPFKFSDPIKAAVDHHVGGAIRDHQRSMHSMPSRPLLNLTARAKKRQRHLKRVARVASPSLRERGRVRVYPSYDLQASKTPHISPLPFYKRRGGKRSGRQRGFPRRRDQILRLVIIETARTVLIGCACDLL